MAERRIPGASGHSHAHGPVRNLPRHNFIECNTALNYCLSEWLPVLSEQHDPPVQPRVNEGHDPVTGGRRTQGPLLAAQVGHFRA